ncbi:DUF3560 domain-containing protein [Longispora sp. NPDC051575]|uniref:DUF3560 domain-containing protein n=1 Tax=Longispora sp. NPDC051575 TaxID=3154943 RepID=UPI003416C4DA
MITITHTPEDGTTLTGSRKGDGAFDLVKPFGFRFHRQVGIYIRGSRDKAPRRYAIDGAAEALRAAGFQVDVSVDEGWRPAAVREEARTERAVERAERLDQAASRAVDERDTHQWRADRVFNMIPPGQPRLVGHHSYRADTARREKALASQDRAIDADKRADHLAGRADGVRAHAARKENSRVIMRRIERLQADLRREERELAEAEKVGASDNYFQRVQGRVEQLTEDIAHQESKLAERAAAGEFVAWSADNLAKGDLVQVSGFGWYRITRVNKKSVSLDSTSWPTKAPWDEIYGRRRDGMQLDTPNGRPWPVQTARDVARWQGLAHSAKLPSGDEWDRRYVAYARRLVHGLDIGAADAEVTAFWPTGKDDAAVDDRRRLAVEYLAVFDRLKAGERVPDIAASLAPDVVEPVWRMPDGEPETVRSDRVRVGDVVAGVWENDHKTIYTTFCGPVAAVTPLKSEDYRTWTRVTLTDGTSKDMTTSTWLSAHRLTSTAP